MRVLSVKTSGYQGEKRKWVASKKGHGVLGGLLWGFVLGHGRKEHVFMLMGSLP